MEPGQTSESGKAGEGRLLTLGDLFKFLFRRRLTIIWVVAGFFLLGALYCFISTPRYKAVTEIEIKRPDDSLGLNSLVQGSSQGAGDEEANPLGEQVTLATKVSELESESLELRVIDELGLETTEDFKPHIDLNPIDYFVAVFEPKGKKEAAGAAFMDSPTRRARALRVFNKHLKIELVPGTRLIDVGFSSPDPDLAAKIVNTLVSDLAQYNFQTKYKSTQQTSSWLADQIDAVRQQADDMEQQESQLRRETETYNMGGTNAAGQSMVYSPLLDHLQQSTLSLSEAETSRILRGAVNQIAQTRDPKLISGLAGSGTIGNGNTQSQVSLNLIQQLQVSEATLQTQIGQDELRLGDANPRLVEERAQLAVLKKSLAEETDRLVQRAQNDYTIAAQEEERTRAEHDALIKRANVVNDKALEYEIVHQEALDARTLYTDLNRRLREAGVLAGLRSADMTVVSPGLSPAKPNSPRPLLVLPVAILAGFIFGGMLAGIQDARDDRVNNVDMVETELAIPVYAVTPDFNVEGSVYGYGKGLYARYGARNKPKPVDEKATKDGEDKHKIIVIAEPDSQYAEAMRVLRTAILLSKTGSTPKSILITSSTPSEGKSTTAINLAATYARTGTRTLLVEVDLRRPVMASRMGLPPSQNGLSRILTGQLPGTWSTAVPSLPNLFCIPAGQRPPDPHELISSLAMKDLIREWMAEYDLVIMDGPPVLPVIDSVLISEQADLVLVITRFGRTSINSLRTTHRLLSRQVHANIGAVLNAVSRGTQGYYEYYGYRNNTYKYEGGEE
ncbi:MAG: polysaccharide biosynthesis tyrosine autokinase [Terracidiphilus sp.]|jgi:capsular exopolysaccharide synthesis family protein